MSGPARFLASPKRPGVKPGDQVVIKGVPCTVATPAEPEQAEIVVCALLTIPLLFADNLSGPCRDCGDMVQWRPHAPKRPTKVCVDCGLIRMYSHYSNTPKRRK